MKKQTLILITIPVLTICFGIAFYALGWTNPTANPPSGNVYTPINTGPVGQSKEGGLIVNTGGASNGLVVQTGNVGIGTTNPTGFNNAKLVVEGNIAFQSNLTDYYISGPANGGAIRIKSSGGTTDRYIQLGLIDNNATFAPHLTVKDGGNVGIGTSTPGAKLSVIGDSIYLGGNNSWGTSIMNHNDSSGNTWRWVTGGGTGDGNIPVGGMAFHKDGAFSPLQIKNDGTVFMNVGNVGIGTSSPTKKLDVAGEVHASGDICTDAGGGKCLSSNPAIYDSGWMAVTRNTTYTLNHGLGKVPTIVEMWFSDTADGSGRVVVGPYGETNALGMNFVDIDDTSLKIRATTFLCNVYDENGALWQPQSGYVRIKAISW